MYNQGLSALVVSVHLVYMSDGSGTDLMSSRSLAC